MSIYDREREALEAEQAKEREEFDRKVSVLKLLPASIHTPTFVPNTPCLHRKELKGAWLSFSKPQQGKVSDVFAALEGAGFKPCPASLAEYGQYRASTVLGLENEAPDIYDSCALGWVEAIAPVWFSVCSYVGAEAVAYYEGPDGNFYRVSVGGSFGIGLSARRIGECYAQGTARLHLPDRFHNIHCEDTCVARPHAKSSAYLGGDTYNSRSIDGAVYIEMYSGQEDFPLSPSEIVKQLED